ncbi:hypothetical protein QA612_09360 [Evansella sp. AB-P1]|uniref:hypothetical protein n=1 Tax=Evansella sp. AB-P1 TaxID=3037653 RepID=UPI00241DFB1E|nr:hypothetical protein [Evansella sp. AB-P1]MDG5787705.1 hypothetical protein [Evansella sp. AB-P1]
MIVKDLVETRELMIEETGDDVVVVYERFDNVDCHCEGKNVETIECDPEEVVQILTGCMDDSLTSVKKYQVGEQFSSLDEIIKDIQSNYGHLLKDCASLTAALK